jgi:hypothetical protein
MNINVRNEYRSEVAAQIRGTTDVGVEQFFSVYN